MAEAARDRTLAGGLLPRRVYPSSKIGGLALQNAEEIYRILFRAASGTPAHDCGRSKASGALRLDFLAVLHTWGQNLHLHPHLHCVVPGGGISPDGLRRIRCRHSFFLPVRVLSCLFKKKFLIYLTKSFHLGKLKFHGQMADLAKPAAFEALCQQANRTDWVVYAKPPFGGPEQVLKYLARYTHRVAISNRRLRSMDDGNVTFKWKDYAGGNQSKTMTLDAVEFIRRFLLHILPPGFLRRASANSASWRIEYAGTSWRRRRAAAAGQCASPTRRPQTRQPNNRIRIERYARCARPVTWSPLSTSNHKSWRRLAALSKRQSSP